MKATCEFDRELLAFAHGHLRGLSWLRMQAHVLLCPSCGARMKYLASVSVALWAVVNGVDPARPVPRTPDEEPSTPWRKSLWRRAGLLAAVAVVAVMLLVGGFQSRAIASTQQSQATTSKPAAGPHAAFRMGVITPMLKNKKAAAMVAPPPALSHCHASVH